MSTAAVKSRWPESQERIAEGVWLIGMASGRGRGVRSHEAGLVAQGKKSATGGKRATLGWSIWSVGLSGLSGAMNKRDERR